MGDYLWTAGQVVFEPTLGWHRSPGRKRTVDRVTPTGRAVIESDQYHKDGRAVGGYGHIVPFTDEHAAALALWERRLEAAEMADNIKWRSLTDDQLDIVLPALRALQEQPK
jgi:hypothetical protein